MSRDQECKHLVKEQCKCVEVAEIARLTALLKSYEAVVAALRHDDFHGCCECRKTGIGAVREALAAIPAPSMAGEP